MEKIETHVRAGEVLQAKAALQPLLAARSLKDRVKLANWCRRLFLPEESVRLLHKQVRPSLRSGKRPSVAACVEYAAALVQLGALLEAEELLLPLVSRDVACNFHLAFLEMRRWNYSKASVFLKEFLKHTPKDHYLYNVAQVNLAACIQQDGQSETATILVEKLISENKENKRLLANLYELKAQAEISLNKIDSAMKSLKVAHSYLENLNSKENIWLKKWELFVRLKGKRNRKQVISELNQLKIKALGQNVYEACRDIDRHVALATCDKKLFEKLYLGSPHSHYRETILKEFTELNGTIAGFNKNEVLIEPSFLSSRPVEKIVETINLCDSGFKVEQVPMKIMRALASDRYAPLSFHSLFSVCYEDYNFTPLHSNNLFHQGLKRCRNLLESSGVPLQIVFENGFYKLHGSRRVLIKFGDSKSVLERDVDKIWGKGKKALSSRDIAGDLMLSTRSANRIIRSMLQAKLVEKIGAGPKTKYRPF